MSLSEDIRAGSKISDPNECFFIGYSNGGEHEYKTCAIGAALLRLWLGKKKNIIQFIDKNYKFDAFKVIKTHYPHLKDVWVINPASCLPIQYRIEDVIMHLNDVEGWSRESIAEWLESLGY